MSDISTAYNYISIDDHGVAMTDALSAAGLVRPEMLITSNFALIVKIKSDRKF